MNLNTPTLPAEVFEAVVAAFADTLIHHYRERVAPKPALAPSPAPPASTDSTSRSSPWLTVAEAAERARCSRSVIYAAARSVQLRTAKAGRLLRVHVDWVDEWLRSNGTR
jgi:excisionase family DNA binding protein